MSYGFSRYMHKLISICSTEKSAAFLGRGIEGDQEGDRSPRAADRQQNELQNKQLKWKILFYSLKKILNYLAKYEQNKKKSDFS